MSFKFPIPPGQTSEPLWTGSGFQIDTDTEKHKIIRYTECKDGWDADLTEFHEREADEGNHYIDRASRVHTCNMMKRGLTKKDSVILEIGSSSGYLLDDIKKIFPGTFLIGSDCIHEPLEKIAAIRTDIPLVVFDLVNCPFPDDSVDVVIALNVLEHIQDDKSALMQIHRILRPGGYAIIEVPANQELFDFYDEELRHFRRYDLKELSDLATNSGFKVIRGTHLGFFIYPFFSYMKRKNKQKMALSTDQKRDLIKKQISLGGSLISMVMSGTLSLERAAGNLIRYPWGIRCSLLLQRGNHCE